MRRLVLAALALCVATPVWADSTLPPAQYANKQLPDPQQEAAARLLMGEIRCLVCQSESIADSNAELAGDMRSIIRTRIAAGEQPEQIRDWLIQRYGNWVSFDPPLNRLTWPLWAAPLVLLAGGLLLARGRFRRRKRA